LKKVFGLLLLCVCTYANSIHIAPKLSLYKIPSTLAKTLPWHDDIKLHASSLGLWVSTPTNLYRLDKPSKALMAPLHVNAFALSQSGHPIIISERHLGLVRHGLFLPNLTLPQSGFELASGANDTLYLYNTTTPSPIYHFDGKMITPVAHPNQAVQALIVLNQTIIFATKEGIFSLEPEKPLGLMIPLPTSILVRSIAINPLSAELFVSTDDTLFSLRDGMMMPLVTGIGGVVSYYDNALWVADTKRKQLYIILPERH
jgi:hypothetical protein